MAGFSRCGAWVAVLLLLLASSVAGEVDFSSFCPFGKKVLSGGGRIARRDYANNQQLCWVLKCNSEKYTVFLSFDAFETQPGRDFIRFIEIGNNGLVLKQELSGELTNPEFDFGSNKGLVSFVSDADVGGDGFRFRWTCRKNPNFVPKPVYTPPRYPPKPRYSPHYPPNVPKSDLDVSSFCPLGKKVLKGGGRVARLDYRNNERLCWLLKCDEGFSVSLSFDVFETEEEQDFLQFVGLSGYSLVSKGRLTGTPDLPQAFDFKHNKGLVSFTSNDAVGGGGFRFLWKCIKIPNFPGPAMPAPAMPTPAMPAPAMPPQAPKPLPLSLSNFCPNGKRVLKGGGRIARLNYRNNERLCWVLKCDKENFAVSLSFDIFATEEQQDFLQLVDISDYGLVSKKNLSGTLENLPREFNFANNKGLVSFTSNDDVSGDGFRFQWTCRKVSNPKPNIPQYKPAPYAPQPPQVPKDFFSFCPNGKRVLSGGGRIARIDYRNNERLCWLLKCDSDEEFVSLIFDIFETEEQKDFIQFVEIDHYSLVSKEMLSGTIDPLPQFDFENSKGLVSFTSNEAVGGRGFRFQWTCEKRVTPTVTETINPTAL